MIREFTYCSLFFTELTPGQKVHRVCIQWIGKLVLLLGLLYLFVCSLDFLSSAFRLLGGRAAGKHLVLIFTIIVLFCSIVAAQTLKILCYLIIPLQTPIPLKGDSRKQVRPLVDRIIEKLKF